MKRCCLERKVALDLIMSIANLFDNEKIENLSEKELKILKSFVDKGIGHLTEEEYKIN